MELTFSSTFLMGSVYADVTVFWFCCVSGEPAVADPRFRVCFVWELVVVTLDLVFASGSLIFLAWARIHPSQPS